MAEQTNLGLRSAVIYSVYVRSHSEEGSFRAVERDLDRIKALGCDILWLMPVHPIGKAKRKGVLGSPYAIEDYREVNPEFGTREDFESLVGAIHARGMKCIIDVVYNHTSPDSWLVKNHPEFFFRTQEGAMGNKAGDWQDVVDLDYRCPELWKHQIDTLKQWAELVDGFRCDVASLVPVEFWETARKEVETVRPGCIWLAETVDPGYILYHRKRQIPAWTDSEIFRAFDISYEYDVRAYFFEYLNGKIPLSYYVDMLNRQEAIYPANYIKLRFLENHDQPRAKKSIPEEAALRCWTAFLYFQKGTTLLYAGQETENVHTPSLFDKETVQWETGRDLTPLMKTLYQVKKHPLIRDGFYQLQAFDACDTVVGSYEAGEDGRKLIGVFPLKASRAEVPVSVPDGDYRNLVDGETVQVRGGKLSTPGLPLIFEA